MESYVKLLEVIKNTRNKYLKNLDISEILQKADKSDLKEHKNKVSELTDIDNPLRELLQALIDKIIIDKDRNVEIVYKFNMLNN